MKHRSQHQDDQFVLALLTQPDPVAWPTIAAVLNEHLWTARRFDRAVKRLEKAGYTTWFSATDVAGHTTIAYHLKENAA